MVVSVPYPLPPGPDTVHLTILNDHQQLCADPPLVLLSGKGDLDQPLAGKRTLSRLERWLQALMRALSESG